MRIIVADDHQLVREGITNLLESAGHTVIGECGDGTEAVHQTLKLLPDLVLMDISMPGQSGLDAMGDIKAQAPDVKVVMLTMSEEEGSLIRAIQEGADGYMIKSTSGDELLESLNALEMGELALSRSMATRVIHGLMLSRDQDHSNDRKLTDREVEILNFIAEGHSNKVIGEYLNVSENTIKYHLKKILQKLNAQNRTQAVSIGMRQGLLRKDSLPQ